MKERNFIDKPRLSVVAPMLSAYPGCVTTQGEILSRLFSSAGYQVTALSTRKGKLARLSDVVWRLLRDGGNIDIQCLNVYGGASFVLEDLASGIARWKGQRIIMHLHGGALPEFFERYPKWSARVLGRADAFVTPSTYLARAALGRDVPVKVIPNVVEIGEYPFRLRRKLEPRLFWMRSFHPIYNPLMAVDVLAGVKQKYPNASLVMAGGDKGMQKATESKVDELGMRGSVEFVGFLSSEGKRQYAENSDVYINTNEVDNMPVAVLEACAFGLPVVSTRVGGIADLLNERETGMLVEAGDVAGMVDAIVELVSNEVLAESLCRNGRSMAERCSWPEVRKQWEEVFERVEENMAIAKKENARCVA